jgi:hypothetical protein
MRIDPALAALGRDRAAERRARATMAAACDTWGRSNEAAPVLAAFARYADGAPLAQCPSLLAAFTGGESATRLVAALVRQACLALVREPFGHPPFRHGFDGRTSTLLLARRGRAQLVVHACEPGDCRFDTVSFSDGERREAVLAGEARARIVSRQGRFGPFAEEWLTLAPGVRLALDLREQALQVLATERRLVSLRLHRTACAPGPTREYDLASGAVLRQAAGDIRASRQEMMLALLGRMRCTAAAPLMAAIAREPGDTSLRWQALRECLALDTAVGFATLDSLACATADPLAAPAGALRARLLAAHAELAAIVAVPCPA